MSNLSAEERDIKFKPKYNQDFCLCRTCGFVRVYFVKGATLQWKDDQVHQCSKVTKK